jgi:hypothetical protein
LLCYIVIACRSLQIREYDQDEQRFDDERPGAKRKKGGKRKGKSSGSIASDDEAGAEGAAAKKAGKKGGSKRKRGMSDKEKETYVRVYGFTRRWLI